MKPRVSESVKNAVVGHRKALVRVVDKQSIVGLRTQYDTGIAKLNRNLSKAFKGQKRSLSSAVTAARMEKVAHAQIIDAVSGIAGEFSMQTPMVLNEGVHRLGQFLGKARSGKLSPLDDTIRSERLALKSLKVLQKARIQSVADVGAQIAGRVTEQLALIPIGEVTVSEMINNVLDMVDSQWWMIERIARTETSRAYNLVQDTGIREMADELPGLCKRWVEYVDDLTGEPYDEKVGDDSIALHGQIAEPDGMFYMPEDDPAPMEMVGMSWEHPPNRPNDRAVIQPWMKEWKIPAWYYEDGERVELK
jgi:hypothetical protein